MAVMNSQVCNFGWKAVDFELKGVDDKLYRLADVRGSKATLVTFICNHCPYVKGQIERIVQDARALAPLGVGIIAIMPNDTKAYPEDSFDNMRVFAGRHDLPFPYAIDETQETARAYGTVCTPDFFGFNADLELQYRGGLDDAGIEPKPDARRMLYEAMVRTVETGRGPADQVPSIGCSIKWRKD